VEDARNADATFTGALSVRVYAETSRAHVSVALKNSWRAAYLGAGLSAASQIRTYERSG